MNDTSPAAFTCHGDEFEMRASVVYHFVTTVNDQSVYNVLGS